jgi:hypothetical protein
VAFLGIDLALSGWALVATGELRRIKAPFALKQDGIKYRVRVDIWSRVSKGSAADGKGPVTDASA